MLDMNKMTQGVAEHTGKAGAATQETQKEVGENDTLSEDELLDYGEEFGFEGTREEIIAQVRQLTPEQFDALDAQYIAEYNAIGESIRAESARIAEAQARFDAELERRERHHCR